MRVHAFLERVCPKVSLVARVESELAYSDVNVQHISHDAAGTLFFS